MFDEQFDDPHLFAVGELQKDPEPASFMEFEGAKFRNDGMVPLQLLQRRYNELWVIGWAIG